MKNIACIITLMLLPLAVQADDATKIDVIEKKVDVIDKKIDKVVEKQERIYEKVENDPLQGRKYGVELNLFRVLAMQDADHSISGTLSYFSHGLNAEIALPFFYRSDSDKRYVEQEGRFTLITIDAHYRRFLGDTMNGFYISGFGRFARLRGKSGEDYLWLFDDTTPLPYATENKFGIGVGIGYRIFSKSGFYWGTSLSVGRYISGENDKFADVGVEGDDTQMILDIELLKFGYAF